MKRVETRFTLELTEEEVTRVMKALASECEYLGEQIAELKNSNKREDVIKCSEIKKDYELVRSLRNGFGNVVGTSFMGMDY